MPTLGSLLRVTADLVWRCNVGQWPACCCYAIACDGVRVQILPADWIYAAEIEFSVKVQNCLMSLSALASSDDITASTTWYHLLM